jgi:transposase
MQISARQLSSRLNVTPSAVTKLVQRGREDALTEKPAAAHIQERE